MPWTPAHGAAGDNDVEELGKLQADGEDLNQQDGAGLTPLHVAASEGALQAVVFLLKNANITDINIQSTMEKASALHKATEEGHDLVIEALLDAQADINAQNIYGYTPLHEAARGENVKTVQLLLEKKADVNAMAFNRTSPLHIAVEMNFIEVIKPLIAAGADVHAEDEDRRTPSSIAERLEGTRDAVMRAMGTMKPSIIMMCLENFIAKLQDRIFKESGLALSTPDKVIGSARFCKLFNFAEFLTFVDRTKYKDKSLVEVRKSDLENEEWKCQCFGTDYFNCSLIFKEPLAKSTYAQHYVTKVILGQLKKGQKGDGDSDSD